MPNEHSNKITLSLYTENELKKLQMAAEFGTDFTAITQLPAHIEQKWLKRIEAAERACQTADRILIKQYLGCPQYTEVGMIKDNELNLHLERVIQDLLAAGINVRTLFKIPIRELYRFLTEDLLEEEIENLELEGIERQYIYEDFYPSDEFEIEQTIIEFFDMLFGKYYAMLESVFYTPDGLELGDCKERADMVDRLIAFSEAFDKLEIEHCEIIGIDMDHAITTLSCDVSYTGYPNIDGEGFTYEGPAVFRLRIDHFGYWSIDSFDVPGMPFCPQFQRLRH